MIDGIGIQVELKDFPRWRLRMPFDIHTPVNTDTGTIKSKSERKKKKEKKQLEIN